MYKYLFGVMQQKNWGKNHQKNEMKKWKNHRIKTRGAEPRENQKFPKNP
jgi:hypothetical protein